MPADTATKDAPQGISTIAPWAARVPALAIDVLVALGVLVVTLGAHFLGTELPHSNSPFLIGLLLCQGVPLLWRRSHPLAMLATVLSAFVAVRLIYSGVWVSVGLLVAVYSLARYADRRVSLITGAVTCMVLVEPLLYGSSYDGPRALFKLAVFVAAWLLGEAIRTRRAYLLQLVERAQRLEREREEHVRRATAEEQARIARELHDVIAHNLSVMVIQAAAADDVFNTQPDTAHQALRTIEATGRQALNEVRRLLATVRPQPNHGQDASAPQPGLSQLEALASRMDAAGLLVNVDIHGGQRPIPSPVDLSAYRIIQEALTNTLRHAKATEVRLCLAYTDDYLELEVVDNGAGPMDGQSKGDGHGLIGMRERALMLGGEFQAGAAPQGGYAVKARLPLDRTAG